MVMRARSVGLLAVAAAPLAAYASVEVPAVQLPSFNCSAGAAGGTIDWGSGLSFQPTIAFTNSDPASQPTYTPLGCSEGSFGESFSKVGSNDIVIIKTQDKSSPTLFLKFDDQNPFDFKYDTQIKGENKVSLWDITLNMQKFNADGNKIGEYKEFIGIEIDSQLKFVNDAVLKLDTDGAFLFDPTIDSSGSITLYAAPQVTPEPGTLVLLGTGLLGIGTAMRRRLGW